MKNIRTLVGILFCGVVLLGTGCQSDRARTGFHGQTRALPPQTERRPVYVQRDSTAADGVIPGASMTWSNVAPAASTSAPGTSSATASAPATSTTYDTKNLPQGRGGWMPVVRGENETTVASQTDGSTHTVKYPEKYSDAEETSPLHWESVDKPADAPSAGENTLAPVTGFSYQSLYSYEKILPGAGSPGYVTQTMKRAPVSPRTPADEREIRKASLLASFADAEETPPSSVSKQETSFPKTSFPKTSAYGWQILTPEIPQGAIGTEVRPLSEHSQGKKPQHVVTPQKPQEPQKKQEKTQEIMQERETVGLQYDAQDPGIVELLSLPEAEGTRP